MRRRIETGLLNWKNRAARMPFLLYGARQTGKTFILNDFGRRHFKNTVYINLETNLRVAEFFTGDLELGRIIRFLETLEGGGMAVKTVREVCPHC